MPVSVPIAPKYIAHRLGVSAIDASVPDDPNAGLNYAGLDTALIQILPSGGAQPDVEIMLWSEAAGVFVSANPKAEFVGGAANEPYEIAVNAAGRILWVRLTVLGAGGSVDMYASSRLIGSIT